MNHLPIVNYGLEVGEGQMTQSSQSIQESKGESSDPSVVFVYPRSSGLMHQISQSTMSTFNNSNRDLNTQSLEAELIRLRESTKEALQQSWDEVEELQKRCSTHAKIIAELENDVVESKKKEEFWHQRCLEAEKQLLQLKPISEVGERSSSYEDADCPSSEESPRSNSSFLLSWKSKSDPTNLSSSCSSQRMQDTGSDGPLPNAFSSGIDITLHSIGTHLSNFSLSRNQNQTKIKPPLSDQYEAERLEKEEAAKMAALSAQVREMEVKLSSREEAIRSLEQTVNQHVKSMHNMQSEMECMVATQRIKQQNMNSAIKGKEENLNKRIASLKDDVVKKEKLILYQKKKMKQYRDYIDELTQELEKVAKLIQDAEERGIYIT